MKEFNLYIYILTYSQLHATTIQVTSCSTKNTAASCVCGGGVRVCMCVCGGGTCVYVCVCVWGVRVCMCVCGGGYVCVCMCIITTSIFKEQYNLIHVAFIITTKHSQCTVCMNACTMRPEGLKVLGIEMGQPNTLAG